MNYTLNYYTCYSEPIQNILKLKISSLVHKLVTKLPNRLIMSVARSDTIQPTMGENFFDEFVKIKFEASEVKFWNQHNIFKYITFITNSSDVYTRNIYINSEYIYNNLIVDNIPKADVVFSHFDNSDVDLINHVMNFAAESLNIDPIPAYKIPMYNANIFAASENIRFEFQDIVKKITNSFNEWISPELTNIILSVVAHLLKEDKNITIATVDSNGLFIDDNLIKYFYVLN